MSLSKGAADVVLDRDHPLFERVVTHTVLYADRDQRQVDLTIRVILGTQRGVEKLLHIEITDEDDPFFLFTLDVNEQDFHTLKQDQCLLVDFASFPAKFIELLECVLATAECHGEDGDEGGRGSPPHFVAVLNTKQRSAGSSLLSIVETNQFKHLTHLSLSVHPGGDTAIKEYLKARLRQIKGDHAKLVDTHRDTAGRLRHSTTAHEQAQSELAALRLMHEQTVGRMTAEHSAQVSDLRERASKTLEDANQEHGRQSEEQAQEHAVAMEKARGELEKARVKNQELSEARVVDQASLRELAQKAEGAARTVETQAKELKAVRAELSESNSTRFRQETELQRGAVRISALQSQVADKDQLLERTAALLEAAKASGATAEAALASTKAAHERLQSKLEGGIAEIHKGNTIISQLQTELRACKSKLKAKASIVRQQEQLLAERHDEKLRTQHQLDSTRAELDAKEAARKGLAQQLEEAAEKHVEQQQLLKQNQQVIQWLNKEINDAQLNFAHTMGAGGEPARAQAQAQAQAAASPFSDGGSFRPSPHSFRPSPAARSALKSTVGLGAGAGGGGAAGKDLDFSDFSGAAAPSPYSPAQGQAQVPGYGY
jgi:spindle assembly abnormal protein 6